MQLVVTELPSDISAINLLFFY